jgi:hypothetical protein
VKDEWGFFRHIKELANQILTVSGMMLAASTVTTIRVLIAGPEFAVWPAIIWQAMQVFNFTGRWIIPQFMQQWFAAKNGVSSTVTSTATTESVKTTVTPTELKP